MTLVEQYQLLNQLKDNPIIFNKPELPMGSGKYLKTVDPGNFYKPATYTPANATVENFINNPTISNTRGQLKTLSPLTSSVDDVVETGGAAAKAAGSGAKLGSWLNGNFGWSKGSGLTAFGKNLGKGANIGSGIMYAIDAIKGANDVMNAQNEGEDLMTGILRSSASNPLASSFLSSDQNAMLNKIKRGSYDSEAGFGDIDLMSLLGGAGKGALTGALFGGIPGAIIGGLGGGLTSNLTRQEQDQSRINTELEGLYQALIEAENQYNTMKRPAITGLGLQSRYQNMFM